MEKELSPSVEKLLQDLKTEQVFNVVRIGAAKKLGQLSTSDLRIVNALVAAMESDPVATVREEAAQSLRAPAHDEILQQHRDLMQRVFAMQAAQSPVAIPEAAPFAARERKPKTETVFCPKCGKTNTGLKLYHCQYCGYSLQEAPRVGSARYQPASTQEGNLAKWIAVLGSIVLIVGSVLPWATVEVIFFGRQSVGGLDGDGVITFALGLVTLILTLVAPKESGKNLLIVAGLLALVAGLIGLYDLTNVDRINMGILGNVSIGVGLYLVVIGAAIAVVGSWYRALTK